MTRSAIYVDVIAGAIGRQPSLIKGVAVPLPNGHQTLLDAASAALRADSLLALRGVTLPYATRILRIS